MHHVAVVGILCSQSSTAVVVYITCIINTEMYCKHTPHTDSAWYYINPVRVTVHEVHKYVP